MADSARYAYDGQGTVYASLGLKATARKVLALALRHEPMGGLNRDDLMRLFGGISYQDLENAVTTLESLGYLSVEWTGPNRFIILPTDLAKKELAARRPQPEAIAAVLG